MTPEQIAMTRSILSGLNYLSLEAESKELCKVTRILKLCMRDICIALSNNSNTKVEASEIYDPDLFGVIELTNKFVAIKDDDLRHEILCELENCHNQAVRTK